MRGGRGSRGRGRGRGEDLRDLSTITRSGSEKANSRVTNETEIGEESGGIEHKEREEASIPSSGIVSNSGQNEINAESIEMQTIKDQLVALSKMVSAISEKRGSLESENQPSKEDFPPLVKQPEEGTQSKSSSPLQLMN
uniref:Uncharacterized protein n=1 Tax=Amaranthus palmeri TaxID=107608 RepID=A0A6C0TA17_AMAPA|nr:hypothetical protein AP_R.00g000440-v1.0.a3 [Amaranthus palmeri]